MKLYKYCDENSVDILKNKRLKISTIDSFNDPFEFRLAVATNLTYETVLEDIQNETTAIKAYELFLELNLCQEMDCPSFLGWFKQHGLQHFAVLQAAFELAMRDSNESLYKKMVDDYRVICLSACPDNILMWSHYGKQHQGILFKFESHNIITDKMLHDEIILKVEYQPERAKLPARLDHRNNDASRNVLMALLKTKYEEWIYERECRIMVGFDHSENNPYIDIDAGAIEEVILGMKCDTKAEMLVKELLRSPEFSHVALKKARMHPDNFSLIYELLPA